MEQSVESVSRVRRLNVHSFFIIIGLIRFLTGIFGETPITSYTKIDTDTVLAMVVRTLQKPDLETLRYMLLDLNSYRPTVPGLCRTAPPVGWPASDRGGTLTLSPLIFLKGSVCNRIVPGA